MLQDFITTKKPNAIPKGVDISFLLEPPNLTKKGVLIIQPIAPYSLSSEQPGTYYQSLEAPSQEMLYGLLENAMGLHLHNEDRKQIFKTIRTSAKKTYKKTPEWVNHAWITQKLEENASNSGFFSLLQFHIAFINPRVIPSFLRFQDLWARHVHSNDTMYPSGSRNHDYRMDRIQALKRSQKITFSDRKDVDIKNAEGLQALKEGNTIHPNAVRPWYPLYYASPTPREYLDTKGVYQFPFQTTVQLFDIIQTALKNPQAPLYLGNNDGWVEASLEELK